MRIHDTAGPPNLATRCARQLDTDCTTTPTTHLRPRGNTAAAIALAALRLPADAVMLVCPSDHHIGNKAAFAWFDPFETGMLRFGFSALFLWLIVLATGRWPAVARSAAIQAARVSPPIPSCWRSKASSFRNRPPPLARENEMRDELADARADHPA